MSLKITELNQRLSHLMQTADLLNQQMRQQLGEMLWKKEVRERMESMSGELTSVLQVSALPDCPRLDLYWQIRYQLHRNAPGEIRMSFRQQESGESEKLYGITMVYTWGAEKKEWVLYTDPTGAGVPPGVQNVLEHPECESTQQSFLIVASRFIEQGYLPQRRVYLEQQHAYFAQEETISQSRQEELQRYIDATPPENPSSEENPHRELPGLFY